MEAESALYPENRLFEGEIPERALCQKNILEMSERSAAERQRGGWLCTVRYTLLKSLQNGRFRSTNSDLTMHLSSNKTFLQIRNASRAPNYAIESLDPGIQFYNSFATNKQLAISQTAP